VEFVLVNMFVSLNSNTTGATNREGAVFPSDSHEFTNGFFFVFFCGYRVAQSSVLWIIVLFRFVIALSIFFELQLLITSLVSSRFLSNVLQMLLVLRYESITRLDL
jgi:hypothetical protein